MTGWLWSICLVGGGGFVGAISRYQLAGYLAKRFPSVIPYGTLSVNLLGCFLLGWLMSYHALDDWKLLIGTGFMGAFTTFSTLKVESLNQLRSGELRAWMLYTFLSYAGGICLAFIGYYI